MNYPKAVLSLAVLVMLLFFSSCGNRQSQEENLPPNIKSADTEIIVAEEPAEVLPDQKEDTTHTVSFSVDSSVTSTTVKSGEKAQRLLGDPVKEGHIFEGWFTAEEGGEKWDFADPINADWTLYARWSPDIMYFNFLLYLEAKKTDYYTGDTIYVDIMLEGDLNYVMAESEIAYNTDLLEYVGYENLSAWAAQVWQENPNTVHMRNLPSIDMNTGASCETPVRLVTLKFAVKNSLPEESLSADVGFNTIFVAATPDIPDPVTAPGEALTLTLHRRGQ